MVDVVVRLLRMALLDGLDRIAWSRLHHAYGPATDVPALLRALVFPETFGPGGSNALVWQRDCYEAIERAVDDVACFFDAPDEATSLEALALVTWFPRQRERLGPKLTGAVSALLGVRRGTALVPLAHLAPREGRELSMTHLRSDDPVVALHAACARVISGVDDVDDQTLSLLVRPSVSLQMESPLAGTLDGLVGRCLRLLPAKHLAVAVGAMAHMLGDAPGPMQRLSLCGAGRPAPAGSVSPLRPSYSACT
jgi:hypothetical protein